MASSPTDFTLGSFTATPEMRDLVAQVLDTGRLSYGPLCRRFEEMFAAMHESKYGVLSNSGTSSLQVALQALKEMYGWRDGDEVIIPALTFVATANVVYHCNLRPVPVDIEPQYYAINADLIEQAIGPKTRAVIAVHPFGQGAEMVEIKHICKDFGLRLIEDSCEAMFVYAGIRPVGSWGDVGCFSTYVAHLITGGVGGIGITNDDKLAAHMRSLVNHGIDLEGLPNGEPYDPTFFGRNFSFARIGHSFRITEMEAALLLPQLSTAHTMIHQRRANAARLLQIFEPYKDHVQLPKVRPAYGHSWMVFPLVMRRESKTAIMKYLRQNRIECRDMLPLVNQPCYPFDEREYPVAAAVNRSGFYIGCHPELHDLAFVRLEKALAEFPWGF